jgi:glucans biosynthesis protein
LYGVSARGLAIDTAVPSGEEFPVFKEFWLERPARGDKELTLYALLDSRRVSGAYRFVLRPGVDTVVDVHARLYMRESVAKFGIAPLTSMYFFGENQRSAVPDSRPEVHDSDGVSVHSGTGEWLWRPLVNPKHLLVTSFALTDPVGFGLMQRDRRFRSYEDLEAHYEKRPSVWIEPEGKWGPGRVELVEIPSPDETNDNIVVYWVPAASPKPGTPFDIEYRMLWQKEAERHPPSSWVTQTRRGHGWERKPDDSISFMMDFEGPALKKLPADEKIKPMVTAGENGKILETNVIRNDTNDGWRMTVKFRRLDEKKPVELRGYLSDDNSALSETWSYIFPPD